MLVIAIISLIILLAIAAGVYYWHKKAEKEGNPNGGGWDTGVNEKPEKPEKPFEESKK